MRQCVQCKSTKSETEFYKRSNVPCGLRGECKDCSNLNCKKNPKRLEYNRKATKLWASKNNLKSRAHWIVNGRLKRGTLLRKPCELCGDKRSHAHHDDYSKPLVLRWLCALHHKQRHARMGWA